MAVDCMRQHLVWLAMVWGWKNKSANLLMEMFLNGILNKSNDNFACDVITEWVAQIKGVKRFDEMVG